MTLPPIESSLALCIINDYYYYVMRLSVMLLFVCNKKATNTQCMVWLAWLPIIVVTGTA